MKIKTKFLILAAFVAITVYTNPGITTHDFKILQAMKQLGRSTDQSFLEYCEYHNYWLFSFTTYLGKPISIGFVGNLHVLYGYLELSMEDHYARHSIPRIMGRGGPPVYHCPLSKI